MAFRQLAVSILLVIMSVSTVKARDFEVNYAVYGAGAQPCSVYLLSMEKGEK